MYCSKGEYILAYGTNGCMYAYVRVRCMEERGVSNPAVSDLCLCAQTICVCLYYVYMYASIEWGLGIIVKLPLLLYVLCRSSHRHKMEPSSGCACLYAKSVGIVLVFLQDFSIVVSGATVT